jgi:hypothetical protein
MADPYRIWTSCQLTFDRSLYKRRQASLAYQRSRHRTKVRPIHTFNNPKVCRAFVLPVLGYRCLGPFLFDYCGRFYKCIYICYFLISDIKLRFNLFISNVSKVSLTDTVGIAHPPILIILKLLSIVTSKQPSKHPSSLKWQ